ncbi:hypothetical protein, partial [Cupriavidus sp. AcVe19-6a]|uniref:hypothetical protein n=1 Tax=Cupriavidus sp. AcVe19-6a TaxID=2821358 RepID=UPI001AE2C5E1
RCSDPEPRTRFHRPDAFWERRYTAIGRMTEATTSLTRAGLLPAIEEIIGIVGIKELDIEFGISNDGSVVIFQVRP